MPAHATERRESPTEDAGTRASVSPGGHVPWRIHPAHKAALRCVAAGCRPAWGHGAALARVGAGGRLSPGLPDPEATRGCSSERSQSQPAEEDQPMLARFPKASRHRGVEAAYWLPQAWSTVNNMPAVSADKPSLMRLQQKHSNMHYRTSAGIFSRACLGKKKKEILHSVCMHTPFIFHSFFKNYIL